MPYRQHSNNSPDDSIVDGNRPQQKQLKWILVSENTSDDPNTSLNGGQSMQTP